MKKKLFIGFLAFMLVGGTAYAAAPGVTVLVNGTRVQDGKIIGSSTMLPLRSVAEALGAQVTYDGAKHQASITTSQPPVQTVQGLSLEQLNKIGESVGLVTALDAAGNPIRSGSGFILNGMLVTNHHVVADSASLKIIFGTKETIVTSNYVFDDADKDLTAVKYDGVSLRLNTAAPVKGDKVYALGFPDKRFMISEGTVQFYSAVHTFVHDAHTAPGSSGGIVVDTNGSIVGVTVGVTEGTDGSHAIPSQTLQDEIKK